jgi:hypothetical protein
MNKITKLWNSLKEKVSKAYAEARKNAKVAVEITNMLKQAVESREADMVVNLIPGNLDNEILLRARKIVAQVTVKMAVAYGIVSENETPSTASLKIVEYLKRTYPGGRTGFWMHFCGEVVVAFADGRITLAEGAKLGQDLYHELFESK